MAYDSQRDADARRRSTSGCRDFGTTAIDDDAARVIDSRRLYQKNTDSSRRDKAPEMRCLCRDAKEADYIANKMTATVSRRLSGFFHHTGELEGVMLAACRPADAGTRHTPARRRDDILLR